MNKLGVGLTIFGGLWLFWSLVGLKIGVDRDADPTNPQANVFWRISHGRLGRAVQCASAGCVLLGVALLLASR